MKFAHTADCHIGGWKEEELKQLNLDSFKKMIGVCIEEHVAFLLISGDLFDTSLPQIDVVREVAFQLSRLKDENIDVYVIPGSHDHSPSGKTMISVFEKAGLCHNVYKLKEGCLQWTEDKTGWKITGVIGLAGGLDRSIYKQMQNKEELEQESGNKIFMFHSLLEECKPKGWELVPGEPYTLLPKNFTYYAGGHPHFLMQKKVESYGTITYPGPLFPNNFKELEELKHGSFYIIDDKLSIRQMPLNIKEVIAIKIDAGNKTPEEVEAEIIKQKEKYECKDKIITVRVEGCLKNGKPSDINFKKIVEKTEEAYCFLKNTYKLTTKEFEDIEIKTGNVEEIEEKIIAEYLGKEDVADLTADEKVLIKSLYTTLQREKHEGETKADHENHLIKDLLESLKLNEVWNYYGSETAQNKKY
ncbi:MAG: metallophosphoesterase [Nanoarchaeota archaeon]